MQGRDQFAKGAQLGSCTWRSEQPAAGNRQMRGHRANGTLRIGVATLRTDTSSGTISALDSEQRTAAAAVEKVTPARPGTVCRHHDEKDS